MQNARENPIAAAAAAAAVSGGQAPTQNNAENLLDFDFDGAAPASLQKQPMSGSSDLEGLAGTPQRVSSPTAHSTIQSPASNGGGGGNNLDELMGIFGNGTGQSNGSQDMMNGFAGMDINSMNQPPPPGQQMAGQDGQKKNEDILGLF